MALYSTVLADQLAAGVNDLEEILKAYINERLGVHGQHAAYRQLQGLKACMKPRDILCFEWQILFTMANDMVDWLPGPEAKLADKTLCWAYLDTYPHKWESGF